MKNKDLEKILQGIDAVGDLGGVNFAYGINKNRKLIERELEDLREAVKPSDGYKEYEKKRVPICEKYCTRDDRGEIKMKNAIRNQRGEVVSFNYAFSDENQKKFDVELQKLNKEFPKALDERKKQVKEYEELLEKESSYVPFQVDYSEIPKDITVKQMDGIIDLLIEQQKNNDKKN